MSWYFLNTGNDLWSQDGNWSDTDGGTPVSGYPNANTEDVFLTSNSGNCRVTANIPVRNFDCTGYKGKLSIDLCSLGVYVNTILSSQMSFDFTSSPTVAGGLRMNTGDGQTLKSNGVIVPSLQVQKPVDGVGILTLLDELKCDVMMTVSQNVTFDGNFGWTVKTFRPYSGVVTPVVLTTSLKPGNTYRITELLLNNWSRGALHFAIVSSVPGTKATLILTGDCNVGYTDFTDIDASGGRTIYSFNGVVTNCVNVVSMTDKIAPVNSTVANSFII